jgi:hypothetical protein
MRRAVDAALVCVYLALAALPVIAWKARLPDHHLNGVLPRAPYLRPTLTSVRREEYQPQITQWLERKLGLRAWSIWIDNTILYHAFGETKGDSHVKVGRGGMLFERDDISYFNKDGEWLPDPRALDRFAADIARLQALLRARGKALVPFFVPSKTSFYPDEVSPLWTRDHGAPRPSTEHVYLAMKRALAARGVVLVDGLEILRAAPAPRDALWGRQARHFSSYAGCLCVRETLVRYAELTGTPPVDYPCAQRWDPMAEDHGDLDLYRLLNAWGVSRDPLGSSADHEPRPAPPAPHAPRTLWIASSFGWVTFGDAVLSGRLPEVHLDYYNSTVHDTGGEAFPVHAFDAPWNELFPTRDLYVLELFETYLGSANYFGVDVVAALLEAFERPPAAR